MTKFTEKKVTIKDIANQVGASLSTVNKALTGKGGISEKRRKEILEVAKNMNYEVNSVAQIMSRKQMTIGVVMPDVINGEYQRESEYYKGLKKGMDEEFEALKKYKINASYYYVEQSDDIEGFDDFEAWLNENEPSAICFCPRNHKRTRLLMDFIVKKRIPMIISGGGAEPTENSIAMISVDAFVSGKMVADFFNCIQGENANSAVVIDSVNSILASKKVSAFSEQLSSYNMNPPKVIESQYSSSVLAEEIERLFKEYPETNCIYATNPRCIPICEYIEKNNLKDKVTLVTTDFFDVIYDYMQKNIIKATLIQNQEKIGQTVVSAAYDYLVKKNTYGTEEEQGFERIFIKPDFCLKSFFDKD